MDYKEKYEQALEVAQRFYNNSVAITKKGLEDIFPELKESIDERIKKVIKQVLSESTTEKDECYLDNGVTQQEVFAWLDEQGEHANFRNKIQIGDKVTRNKDGVLVNLSQLNRVAKKDEKQCEQPKKHDVCDNCDQQGCCVSPCPMKLVEKHGEQKPAAWSEEDDENMKEIILFCDTIASGAMYSISGERLKSISHTLKSLRPQNRWKPSEREKEALLWCVVHLGGADKQTLGELLEELNKL